MRELQKILIVVLLLASAQAAIAQLVPCGKDLDVNRAAEDCWYYLQWHLKNNGDIPWNPLGDPTGRPAGQDIDVEPVWDRYKGEGTYISIVDGDVELDHEDLVDNVSTPHSIDFYPSYDDTSSHGTYVAGIAAARDNLFGVRGVAPRAKIYSFNIFGGAPDPNTGNTNLNTTSVVVAMTRHSAITAVSNNSWGAVVPFQPSGTRNVMWQLAVETGIREGYYGKGTVYTFAAGNERCLPKSQQLAFHRITFCNTDNANYDARANYHAIVAVCAVNDKGRHNGASEFGANLWVCAPSRGENPPAENRAGIVTTDTENGYTNNFGGTSASTPMVSGVVALMRDANENLSWRDVKLILANSARQNHRADDSWAQGAIKYGSFAAAGDEERYNFSHKYGFGVVNAEEAVRQAENWINLPPREPDTISSSSIVNIINGISTSTISIQSDINFIEHLDIYVAVEEIGYYDLSIKLESPMGTISELAVPSTPLKTEVPSDIAVIRGKISGDWRFGSSRHLGENPTGDWKLRLENTRDPTGILAAWVLRMRGYQIKIDAAATKDLLESNVEHTSLTLSVVGARWKPNLQPLDFKLKNAPLGLTISEVSRTSDTQIQLTLALNQDLTADYQFQVEATTGTVSNLAQTLVSNDITIALDRPIVIETISVPRGLIGSSYNFWVNLADIFIFEVPATTLTYTIDNADILQGSGLTATIENDRLVISGILTKPGYYLLNVTATTPKGASTTTSFLLRISSPNAIEVKIKVFLEGALKSN